MTPSQFSDTDTHRAIDTLQDILRTITQLSDWNRDITSVDFYYSSERGMQLLAANCTLITAIGEGINRIERVIPGFLSSNFPQIPWRSIVGMRNHIAHGYFELDAEVVFEAVKNDIPPLQQAITDAASLLTHSDENT